jgi:hypothetical protein
MLLAMSSAHAEGLVDPTRPPATRQKAIVNAPAAERVAPRVTAIFRSGERCVAVFDGKVVKAGDRIGDLVIEAIVADGVRFRRAGQVLFERLPTQAAAVVRRKVDSEEREP